MTRWARSGNSQKHKKMPGDATPWKDLSNKKAPNSDKGYDNFKSKKGTLLKNKQIGIFRNPTVGEGSKIKKDFKKNKKLQVSHNKCITVDNSVSDQEKNLPNICTNVNESQSDSEKPQENTFVEKGIDSVQKKKQKCGNKKVSFNEAVLDDNEKKSAKKKYFMEKLQKKRTDKGILLLPSNVERKLYNIKRKLREKGFPPETIKSILRKERRSAELKFRKSFSSKTCYNCRQEGHILAECPYQRTGICFKCGSSEHSSMKCSKKVVGFPFASCFICKEQGHISRDCPQNKQGIYIKGGKCNLCGNVNHLRKDCPTLTKIKEEENELTADTINEGTSVDAEVAEMKSKKTSVQASKKKARVVKF